MKNPHAWAEKLAKAIRGPVMPKEALSIPQLTEMWGLSPKGAALEAERRFKAGELDRAKGRGLNGRWCWCYWPKK